MADCSQKRAKEGGTPGEFRSETALVLSCKESLGEVGRTGVAFGPSLWRKLFHLSNYGEAWDPGPEVRCFTEC